MPDEKLSGRERRRQKSAGGRQGHALKTALTVEARRVRAFELKVQAWSLREIAAELGVCLATVSQDLTAVREELAEAAQAFAAKERDASLARIDKAVRAIMPRVEKGEPEAILSLDRMERRRAALLGLDAPTKTELSGPEGAPITLDARSAILERLAGLTARAAPAGAADAVPRQPVGG